MVLANGDNHAVWPVFSQNMNAQMLNSAHGQAITSQNKTGYAITMDTDNRAKGEFCLTVDLRLPGKEQFQSHGKPVVV